ncbi:MAG: hypothetical protein CM1200mP12_01440 [Gammaproteobacteria bacterium]|nr:MAG: hypothetical protein CM1200mP12_01440 [Gammaproteobacteria bacterium]
MNRGDKPVHWCVDCGSALAEAEVEYEDKISSSIDFGFPIDNKTVSTIFLSSIRLTHLCFPVGPQHLGLCLVKVALTVNAEFDYCLVQVTKDP